MNRWGWWIADLTPCRTRSRHFLVLSPDCCRHELFYKVSFGGFQTCILRAHRNQLSYPSLYNLMSYVSYVPYG